MLRRKSVDDTIQLDATDVVKLETALRRAVAEARNVMSDLCI